MGATDELKNGDATPATILKSGTWESASYRQYLDIQSDESLNIYRHRFIRDIPRWRGCGPPAKQTAYNFQEGPRKRTNAKATTFIPRKAIESGDSDIASGTSSSEWTVLGRSGLPAAMGLQARFLTPWPYEVT